MDMQETLADAGAAQAAAARPAPASGATGPTPARTAADASAASVAKPYFCARGLGLKTYAGYAYRAVDVDARAARTRRRRPGRPSGSPAGRSGP